MSFNALILFTLISTCRGADPEPAINVDTRVYEVNRRIFGHLWALQPVELRADALPFPHSLLRDARANIMIDTVPDFTDRNGRIFLVTFYRTESLQSVRARLGDDNNVIMSEGPFRIRPELEIDSIRLVPTRPPDWLLHERHGRVLHSFTVVTDCVAVYRLPRGTIGTQWIANGLPRAPASWFIGSNIKWILDAQVNQHDWTGRSIMVSLLPFEHQAFIRARDPFPSYEGYWRVLPADMNDRIELFDELDQPIWGLLDDRLTPRQNFRIVANTPAAERPPDEASSSSNDPGTSSKRVRVDRFEHRCMKPDIHFFLQPRHTIEEHDPINGTIRLWNADRDIHEKIGAHTDRYFRRPIVADRIEVYFTHDHRTIPVIRAQQTDHLQFSLPAAIVNLLSMIYICILAGGVGFGAVATISS